MTSANFSAAIVLCPVKVFVHSFNLLETYASGDPPPATINGFSNTSFVTIKCIMNRTICLINYSLGTTADKNCNSFWIFTSFYEYPFVCFNFSFFDQIAAPKSLDVISSRLLITRAPVALDNFVISLSFTRLTVRT